MKEEPHIQPPQNEEDTEGARRVFEEFLVLYEPTLEQIDQYLEQMIKQAGPAYADAYRPWHVALRDLFRGVNLTAKKAPLPDPESFLDAIKMFSFDGAIRLLRDICVGRRMALRHDWMERFHEHINLLLFSAAILKRHPKRPRLP